MRTSGKYTPAIAIPAYDRPASLERLLNSLAASRHHGKPDLLVSIDGGAPSRTHDVAQDAAAQLSNFNVKISTQPENLGLKRHILALGELAEAHGSVIVLEDDLVVDPFFYEFSVACLNFYDGVPEIAGHALYSPNLNETAQLPFAPMANGYSTYFMQVPCSWGQCWTLDQWQSFKGWLDGSSSDAAKQEFSFPPNVAAWSDQSWKKHFVHYLIEKGLYFTYPYLSYTSNCSSVGGTHIKRESSLLQVPLASPHRNMDSWQMCPVSDREVTYDAFMEASGEFVFRSLCMARNDVAIDLYGTKPTPLLRRNEWAVTTKPTKRASRSFPQQFKPVELNLAFELPPEERGEIALGKSSDVKASRLSFDLKRFEYWTNVRWRLARVIALTKAAIMAFGR